MDRSKIYTILMFTKLEKTEYGFPDFGAERLVGYYMNYDDATRAVKENWADIAEHCYHYALIEEVEEGLYQPALDSQRWLYEYNVEKEEFDPIKQPEWMKHFSGFTIG